MLDSAALPDIADGSPAGENLEFDSEFAELERLAQGKPEQQYGTTIVPAEEPEWRAVVAAGRALMARTYDLRVMAHLAVGRLHQEGVAGFAETVGALRHVLETRWAEVHPQLDPEDDNDPTLRANALLRIAEPVRVLRHLRGLPLARSGRAGPVSWRDIAIATGTLEADEDAARLGEGTIEGAFRDTDPAALAGLRDALDTVLRHAAAIPAAFDSQAGQGSGPGFTELSKLLRDMIAMIDRYARMQPEAEAASAEAEPAEAGSPAPVRSAAAVSIATMGPPTNRADAARLLELVIEYYEKHEPSSPLPLLIARARRLSALGFMDILRDMAPDGVSQAEMIAGRPE